MYMYLYSYVLCLDTIPGSHTFNFACGESTPSSALQQTVLKPSTCATRACVIFGSRDSLSCLLEVNTQKPW